MTHGIPEEVDVANTCGNCWFSKLAGRMEHGKTRYEVLECHRYAPRHVSGVGTGYESELFPEVPPDNWCGEWYLSQLPEDKR